MTAVEFALIAPVCFTLVCGFIDISMIMFISNVMEGGLREASRFAITGYAPDGKTREQRIAEIVKDHSYNLIKQEDITITYKVYPSFGDVGKPEPFVDQNSNGVWNNPEPYHDLDGDSAYDAPSLVNGTINALPWTLTPVNGGTVPTTGGGGSDASTASEREDVRSASALVSRTSRGVAGRAASFRARRSRATRAAARRSCAARTWSRRGGIPRAGSRSASAASAAPTCSAATPTTRRR